jgi:hypothetical protein
VAINLHAVFAQMYWRFDIPSHRAINSRAPRADGVFRAATGTIPHLGNRPRQSNAALLANLRVESWRGIFKSRRIGAPVFFSAGISVSHRLWV